MPEVPEAPENTVENNPDNPSPPAPTYSAFLPTLAVFVALAAVHVIYLFGDLNERAQIKRAHAELGPLTGQAARVMKVVDDLSKDLVALAGANDPEAAKIVTEFKIKTNQPASKPAAPSAQ
jgi:hypothetical protein